jgi:hypothetical protein
MSINSFIQGKRITHTYEIKENKDLNTGKFTRKPELITHDEIVWETLLKENGEEFVVDGEIGHTSGGGWLAIDIRRKINISETEEVGVEQQIYRADIHAYMVHTDKVVGEEDAVDSGDTKVKYGRLVCEYNEQMIKDDEKLSAYCKVHNLTPANTDYDELRKVVHGENALGLTPSGITVSSGVVKGYMINPEGTYFI